MSVCAYVNVCACLGVCVAAPAFVSKSSPSTCVSTHYYTCHFHSLLSRCWCWRRDIDVCWLLVLTDETLFARFYRDRAHTRCRRVPTLSTQFHAREDFFNELSPCLRNELTMALNGKCVRNLGLFQGFPEALVVEIVNCLRFSICLQYDVVILEGSIGHSMFFVRAGR